MWFHEVASRSETAPTAFMGKAQDFSGQLQGLMQELYFFRVYSAVMNCTILPSGPSIDDVKR
jgi:hypothetical protein